MIDRLEELLDLAEENNQNEENPSLNGTPEQDALAVPPAESKNAKNETQIPIESETREPLQSDLLPAAAGGADAKDPVHPALWSEMELPSGEWASMEKLWGILPEDERTEPPAWMPHADVWDGLEGFPLEQSEQGLETKREETIPLQENSTTWLPNTAHDEPLPEWTANHLPNRWTKSVAENIPQIKTADAAKGLEWLYQQTAQAARQTAFGLASEPAAPETQTTSILPAALTVEELDRAVKRDSRRYDGEMKLF